MKCDELKRKYSDITGPYYGCNEVDEAIDELKKKLMPCLNGDCILTCEVVEKYGKENAELKQKLEYVKKLIKTARQMLEDAKASQYAEMVDSGMRERRLRRALWLARANSARNSYLKWNLFANFESEEKLFTIDEHYETPGATDGQVLQTYTEWMKTWNNVERKCRAKAEQYK